MRRFAAFFLLGALSCMTNPITGRSQFILISEEQELALGAQGYQELLGELEISTDQEEVEPTVRVARRIAAVADQYMTEKLGKADYPWEFSVVKDDKTVNAFCLPGGKIVVFTGIYPVAHDEAGLAVIVGHEVSHALGRHGAERVSQGMMVQLGGALLATSLHRKSKGTVQGALAAYGIGMNVAVLLPHSRDNEVEADRLGLELAAKAGYDPRAGVEVWKRMQHHKGGGGPPEFLSTHPSDDRRIANMELWMPEVLPYFESAPKAPAAALPPIGRRRRPVPPGGVGAAGAGYQVTRLEKGNPAIAFRFAFDRDAYVDRVVLAGPGGLSTSFDAKAAVMANRTMQVGVWREDPEDPLLPSGRYTVTFEGRQSGRPFRSTAVYQVQ